MKFSKSLFISLCGAVGTGLSAASVDVPTPAPMATQVQPQLNVQIGRETEQITFVNTNNDPYVYTKVYKLKHADPYEIRPYVMAAIRSRRVDTSVTKVEAVKYQDGTGMLLVSAEEYRFFPVENGMSLDQIIEMLDRPNLASEAGRRFFLYYPKYFDSVTLAGLIRKVGMQHAGDNAELQGRHRHGRAGYEAQHPDVLCLPEFGAADSEDAQGVRHAHLAGAGELYHL